MRPNSRGVYENDNVYGKTTPSFYGRVTHLASIGAIVALGYYRLNAFKIIMALLVATKLVSNFTFRKDDIFPFLNDTDVKKMANNIPDPLVEGLHGMLIRSLILHGHGDEIKTLLRSWMMKIQDKYQNTPLEIAATFSPQLIPLLLKYNPSSIQLNSALQVTTQYGFADATEALLQHQDGKAFSKENIEEAQKVLKASSWTDHPVDHDKVTQLLDDKLNNFPN